MRIQFRWMVEEHVLCTFHFIIYNCNWIKQAALVCSHHGVDAHQGEEDNALEALQDESVKGFWIYSIMFYRKHQIH